MACEICTQILEAFKTPIDDELETPFGPHHQILKYTCQQCHHIRERVYFDCCNWLIRLGKSGIHPHIFSIKLHRPRGQHRLHFSMSYPQGSWGFALELVRGASTPWSVPANSRLL